MTLDQNTQLSFLDVAVENLTEGVVFVSGIGEIVHMNPEALRIHGFSSLKEMLRHAEQYPLRIETLDGKLLELKDWPINRMLRGERFKEMEVRLFNTNPKTQREWIGSYGGSPILKSGEVVAGVLTVRDITHSKAHELQIRQLADSMTQLAWIARADGNIQWYNKRWFEYTGTTLAEMAGWGWKKVHHPDHIERVVSYVKEAWQKPEPFELTIPLRSAAGEWRWFLTRAVPLMDAQGRILQWFGTNTDITDQREREQKLTQFNENLKRERSAYENIFQSAPSANALLRGHDFVFEMANEAYYQIVGHHRDIIGKPLLEALPEVASQPFPGFLKEVFETGKNLEFHEIPALLERAPGKLEERIIDVTYQRVEQEGVPYGVFVQALDITERVKAQKGIAERERRFKTITDNAASCLFMMDKNGHPTFMNPAAERLTGYKLDEISDKPLHYAIHYKKPDGSHYPIEECPIDNAQAELKRLQNQEEIFTDKAGRLYPASYSVAPLERDGEVIGSVLEFRDITEQKRVERVISESERRLNLATSASNIGIWEWEIATDIIDVTNTERRIFDLPTTCQITLDQIFSKILPEDVEEVRRTLLEAVENKTDYQAEFRIRRNDGAISWQLWRGRPVYDSSGKPIKVTGVNLDTTETKKFESDLRNAIVARDEFLSIASHELKTPLTSLKLQAQIMQRSISKNDPKAFSEDRVVSMVEQTAKQVSRLSRLVDDMLDVSRIRSGKLTIERKELDFCEVVREVIERLKNQLIAGSYETPTLFESGECHGSWDRMRMEQVITNLLTNAIKYGNKKPISIALEGEKDRIHLSVQDQGIGIGPEAQKKIFDRFERAVNANEVSGLGLGLFITKQIVVAHGGSLWVESEIGKGSTFHVEIPRSLTPTESG